MDVLSKVIEKKDEMVRIRRHLHENPECGPKEQVCTLDYIMQELDKIGVCYVRVPNGGVVATIGDSQKGKTVLLRADVDALPIDEDENNLVQKKICISKIRGVMHACGHDGHVAMQLVEAMILKEMEDELNGRVILAFEEGEECSVNTVPLCEYLVNIRPKIDTCYATHVRWDIPVGKVSCCDGFAMTGLYFFKLDIHGSSAHGSRPDMGHSALDCFHDIYNKFLSLRMNYIAPNQAATWSFGRLSAGTAVNILPDQLSSEGSIRFSSLDSGHKLWMEMERTVKGVCEMNYCSGELNVEHMLLPVHNNDSCRNIFLSGVKKYLGEDRVYDVEPWMASETFSFLTNLYPSVLSFTGIQNKELGSGSGHHTPKFDLDEDGLIYGATAAIGYALEYLDNPPDLGDYKPEFDSLGALVERLDLG